MIVIDDVTIEKIGDDYSLSINGTNFLRGATYSECLGELVRLSLAYNE